MAVSIESELASLTHSQIQTAKTCLRKHALAYEHLIRKEQPDKALHIGEAVHVGLDARARALNSGLQYEETTAACIKAAVDSYDAHLLPISHEGYPAMLTARTAMITLLNAYCWRYRDADIGMKIIASELPFEVPIINPETNRSSRTFRLAGKIDKIVQLHDGRLALMEHKTVGRDIGPETDYWKRLIIDSQISTYYVAALELGYKIDTVLYDVLRKPESNPIELTQSATRHLLETSEYVARPNRFMEPTLLGNVGRIVKSEGEPPSSILIDGEDAEVIQGAKNNFAIRETLGLYAMRLTQDMSLRHEYYFGRREIPRIEKDLDEFRFELWEEAKRIHFHRQRGIWPRNTQACIGFGRCPYFDLCTSGFEPAQSTLPMGYYVASTPHEELEVA